MSEGLESSSGSISATSVDTTEEATTGDMSTTSATATVGSLSESMTATTSIETGESTSIDLDAETTMKSESSGRSETSIDADGGNTDSGGGSTDSGEGSTDSGEGSTDSGEGSTDSGEDGSESSSTGDPAEPCGNGRLDVDEICDDGNIEDDDWCSASCDRVGMLDAGPDNTCGIHVDGSVECWGSDAHGQSSPPPGLAALRLSVSGDVDPSTNGIVAAHGCAVDLEHRIVCWGSDDADQATPPPGTFRDVQVGNTHSCGLTEEASEIDCWGDSTFRQLEFPAGSFASLAIGHVHGCVLAGNGAPTCWGNNGYGEARPPEPPVQFNVLSAGGLFNCGVRSDTQQVQCWGRYENHDDGFEVPVLTDFEQLTTGAFHACGLRSGGTVVCWGNDYFGQSTPPPEVFLSVSAGNNHTCGITNRGEVRCWGDDRQGQAPDSL